MPRSARFVVPLLLLALPSACTDDGGDDDGYCAAQDSWNGEWAAYEDEVLAIVNTHRVSGGECDGELFGPGSPLSMDSNLRCAARNHSMDMGARDYFSHDTPEGESFVDRVDKTDYAGFPAGENIALGYPTPDAVMAGWMASPGHCKNIMNPNHTQIGIGHYGEGSYWTQVMGRE